MSVTPLSSLVDGVHANFRLHADVLDELKVACLANRDVAHFHVIGTSEKDRPIVAVTIGTGPVKISLLAGAHADEPVGPETLRHFITNGLRHRDKLGPLFDEYTFCIVPHVNPDGESRNRPWIREWPDPVSFVRDVVRELPGRDVEFGYPDLRPENRAVSRFLEKHGPFAVHLSLHGMAFAEGGSLLINRNWSYRTESIRSGFASAVDRERLTLHDHNRFGEKGFFYLGPGFNTSPEGTAMRTFFRSRGEDKLADNFKMSSMEFVESLGGDPLCVVTEIPLFVVTPPTVRTPGVPTAYLEFKNALPDIQKKIQKKKSIDDTMARFFMQPVSLATGMRLQLAAIELSLAAEAASRR